VAHELEAPCGDDADWSRLYRARGEEVVQHRPVFTGDTFVNVVVQYPDGSKKRKNLIIVQHPCAMRSNGVDLVSRLLVAEVRNHRVIPPDEWTKYGKNMPLPDLIPTVDTGKRNQAGFFDELHLVEPDALENRVACLSQLGVNLLLQRWIRHNSRAVVPTFTLNEVTSGVFEEADLIEEWCEERMASGVTFEQATKDCVAWLREDAGGGQMRQKLLEDPQNRSGIRKQMRAALRGFLV
jgi:hypothetical protein